MEVNQRERAGAAARREEMRRRLLERAPSWYRPWAHLLFPTLFGLGIAAGALAAIHQVTLLDMLTLPLWLVVHNADEWFIHRAILHRRSWPLGVLFDRHTPEHHVIYVSDDMSIRSPKEFRLVLIPAYGIVATLVATLPVPILLTLLGQRNIGLFFVASVMIYTVAYEWLHLSYHLPQTSRIGRSSLITRLARHHATHHDPRLMQKWNFNVTIPLWDWVRGTRYPG